MYSVRVEQTFSAAHKLVGYDGPCGRWHGHNYKVVVVASSTELHDEGQEFGMVIDLTVLKGLLKQVIDPLDHRTLLSEWQERELKDKKASYVPLLIPRTTSEHLARYVWLKLKHLLSERNSKVERLRVEVWESEKSYGAFEENIQENV